jgi:hypothetical protein
MSISFPNLPPWEAAGWVVRSFWALAQPHLAEVPGIAPDLEDGLISGILVLDLRDAPADSLDEARLLIQRVLADAERKGERDFADPAAFPLFIDRLRDLDQLAARAVAAAHR